MTLSTRQRGTLEWTGEHWIAILRPDGVDRDSAIVSLFALRYSPAGEGCVGVVRIMDARRAFEAVCTDNEKLLPFALPRFFERMQYWSSDLPVKQCHFERIGDTKCDPGWRIEPDGGEPVEVCWHVRDAPVTINTPWRNGRDVFSILFFTDEAEVHLAGRRIPGTAYLRDIWRDSIGGDRSSCVFALAESFFDVQSTGAGA